MTDHAAVKNTMQPEDTPELRELYDGFEREHLIPLWTQLGDLMPIHPKPKAVPHVWKWSNLYPLARRSGDLVPVGRGGERRAIGLANPGLGGRAYVSPTLWAAIQFLGPKETAPEHRHAQNAFRFVVEGEGVWTVVNGDPVRMSRGDFLLTPGWHFHGHHNETDKPMAWIDGLDIPLIRFLDASFAERLDERGGNGMQPVTQAEGDALARYGHNMLPLDWEPTTKTSPVFHYPYARSREALDRLARSGPLHPAHGIKLQYVNPASGASAIPTMGTFLQLLPKGFRGRGERVTDGTIYNVVEGSGRTTIGDRTFEWSARDIFVAPSWLPVVHEADDDAVLFSYSDRPVQKALGLWRSAAV